MNKKELNNYIFTKLIKNDRLIASAVQWGLVDKIEDELNRYVNIGNSSVEKLFRYLNNDNSAHICYCGKNVEFMSFTKGFRKFCSTSCSRKSRETQQKYHATMQIRYSCDNCLDKKGVIWEKIKQTNIEKYGDIFPYRFGSQKNKNAMMNKYGVEHNTAIPSVVVQQQISQKRKFAPKKYKTIFGNDVYYQSKPELEFVQVCENNNIFVENGPTVEYYLHGKKHYYHIDFKTKNSIIEIKSNHTFYKDAIASGEIDAKNNAAEQYAKMNNLFFMFLLDKNKEDYNNILKEELIHGTLNNWRPPK